MFGRCWWVAVCVLGSCSVDGPTGQSTTAIDSNAELILHRQVNAPAPGTDERPLYTVAWRHPDGRVEALPLERPVIYAVRVGETVFYGDGEHRLWRFDGEGSAAIGEGVFARPVVWEGVLAYVSGQPQVVHLWSVDGERAVETGLYQLGALRFGPEGDVLFGVGSRNGGVAGVHVVDLAEGGTRCLTNCALRVGEPWPEEAFVPNPAAGDAFDVDGDEVRWDTPSGRVAFTWRAP